MDALLFHFRLHILYFLPLPPSLLVQPHSTPFSSVSLSVCFSFLPVLISSIVIIIFPEVIYLIFTIYHKVRSGCRTLFIHFIRFSRNIILFISILWYNIKFIFTYFYVFILTYVFLRVIIYT